MSKTAILVVHGLAAQKAGQGVRAVTNLLALSNIPGNVDYSQPNQTDFEVVQQDWVPLCNGYSNLEEKPPTPNPEQVFRGFPTGIALPTT